MCMSTLLAIWWIALHLILRTLLTIRCCWIIETPWNWLLTTVIRSFCPHPSDSSVISAEKQYAHHISHCQTNAGTTQPLTNKIGRQFGSEFFIQCLKVCHCFRFISSVFSSESDTSRKELSQIVESWAAEARGRVARPWKKNGISYRTVHKEAHDNCGSCGGQKSSHFILAIVLVLTLTLRNSFLLFSWQLLFLFLFESIHFALFKLWLHVVYMYVCFHWKKCWQ